MGKFKCPQCDFDVVGFPEKCEICGLILDWSDNRDDSSIVEPPPQEKHLKVNKNLFECNGCGVQIAKAARACPHCGAPVPTIAGSIFQTGCGIVVVGISLCLISIILLIYFGPKKPKETAEQRTVRVERQIQARAERQAKEIGMSVERYKVAAKLHGESPGNAPSVVKYYLKDHLNNPDSLSIEGWTQIFLSPKGWEGSVEYRAKNTFGGYVRKRSRFAVQHGKVVAFWDPTREK